MNSELSDFQNALRTAMQENWKWFVFQGIVMLILGCLAVAEPVIASVAVDIYIGWLFMFGGVLGLVAMHRRSSGCCSPRLSRWLWASC